MILTHRDTIVMIIPAESVVQGSAIIDRRKNLYNLIEFFFFFFEVIQPFSDMCDKAFKIQLKIGFVFWLLVFFVEFISFDQGIKFWVCFWATKDLLAERQVLFDAFVNEGEKGIRLWLNKVLIFA